MSEVLQVKLPPGRLVEGSLYKGQDKDATGNQKVYKTGTNAGQPRTDFYFAVAIPKTPGVAHWGSEAWGAPIWGFGHQVWPNGQASAPTFAWKIEDGDSTIPNKQGRKNCEKEGHPGNWIVKCSRPQQPTIVSAGADGKWHQNIQPDFVKPGDYIEVAVSIASNESQSPGVYMNHEMVAFLGFGERIQLRSAIDPNAMGFGQGPAPAGMTAVPPGAGSLPQVPGAAPATGGVPALPPVPAPVPAQQAAPAVPGIPALPSAPVPAPAAAAAPATPPPVPMPTAPNPAFTQAAQVTLTAKAGNFTLEQFLASGWTIEKLRAEGYIV